MTADLCEHCGRWSEATRTIVHHGRILVVCDACRDDLEPPDRDPGRAA